MALVKMIISKVFIRLVPGGNKMEDQSTGVNVGWAGGSRFVSALCW